jgi:hypothetical protein
MRLNAAEKPDVAPEISDADAQADSERADMNKLSNTQAAIADGRILSRVTSNFIFVSKEGLPTTQTSVLPTKLGTSFAPLSCPGSS